MQTIVYGKAWEMKDPLRFHFASLISNMTSAEMGMLLQHIKDPFARFDMSTCCSCSNHIVTMWDTAINSSRHLAGLKRYENEARSCMSAIFWPCTVPSDLLAPPEMMAMGVHVVFFGNGRCPYVCACVCVCVCLDVRLRMCWPARRSVSLSRASERNRGQHIWRHAGVSCSRISLI